MKRTIRQRIPAIELLERCKSMPKLVLLIVVYLLISKKDIQKSVVV